MTKNVQRAFNELLAHRALVSAQFSWVCSTVRGESEEVARISVTEDG